MRLAAIAFLALAASGCGYHAGGRGDLLPKGARTIAIPAFANLTTRYRLTDRMPAALTREFLARTKYRVVEDPADADLVLRGAVVNYIALPNVLDQPTGRAVGVQVNAYLQVRLTDRAGKVLFDRPYMEVRQRYEISTVESQYFEESETALERMSREVARTLVSNILEAF